MLGILALGLTSIMIYTLVKNALVGKQLSREDAFTGTVELIIPVTSKSEFFDKAWQASLATNVLGPGQLTVHLLVDGHHPMLPNWEHLKSEIPNFHIHNYPMRPADAEPTTWMIEQISSSITGQVVIIGDPELVPTPHAFLSIGKAVTEKQRTYFVVPQTAKRNVLGEAISVLNPTLAFASFFGFKKWRKNITHPLLNISEGWMSMSLASFKELDLKAIRPISWKEFISRQWDEKNKTYHLAFGEKQLIRFYPDDLKVLTHQMRVQWEDMWNRKEKAGFFLFCVALFLWSFPVVCFFSHPFWAIASFFLLILYRFFSKIVFQESWGSIVLHAVACVFWIGTLAWFGYDVLSEKYFKKKHQGMN